MLSRDAPGLRWIDCAGPLMASFATNNVLPFRAGDLLRAFGFNRDLRAGPGTVLATVFVERLLDLLTLLGALGLVLGVFGLDAHRLAGIGGGVLLTLSAAMSVLLFFPEACAALARSVARLAARVLPRVGDRILAESERAIRTLEHLAAGGTVWRLVAWSVAIWFAEGVTFWCAAKALPGLPTPSASWLALPVGTLATLIPSTPGYVGTFDYFTIRAMSVLHNPPSAAAAYAVLVHLLLWLPPTLVGGAYLVTRHATLAGAKEIS